MILFSDICVSTNTTMIFKFQASAFIVTYPVNNAAGDVGNENGKALAWEKAFIQLAKVSTLQIHPLIVFVVACDACLMEFQTLYKAQDKLHLYNSCIFVNGYPKLHVR